MEEKLKFNEILKARDNVHYNFRALDGYNKFWNFVISPRNDGKSTEFLLMKAYKKFYEEGKCSIFFRRNLCDLTDAYMESQQDIINKFLKDEYRIKISYKSSSKGDGCIDAKINDKVFIRFIGLNQRTTKLKSLFLSDLAYCFMDEFIVNVRTGEKYLPGEAFKMKEVCNTFWREAHDLKIYFCGNPYSLYNPYFSELGIQAFKLKKGTLTSGVNWVVDRHELSEELKSWLKEHNPLYNSQDEYTQYALEGDAINDANIIVNRNQPAHYKLAFVFRVDGKYIGVYRNDNLDDEMIFWVGYIDEVGARRTAYCFDFKDLINRSVLYDKDDKRKMYYLAYAIRNRKVAFESIECDYMVEEIYKCI